MATRCIALIYTPKSEVEEIYELIIAEANIYRRAWLFLENGPTHCIGYTLYVHVLRSEPNMLQEFHILCQGFLFEGVNLIAFHCKIPPMSLCMYNVYYSLLLTALLGSSNLFLKNSPY